MAPAKVAIAAAAPALAARPVAPSNRTEVRPVLKTTKEWVVPPRPKPGRKPAQVEPESSRKALNRASQRAFRERRQEYVAELEEKVRELEQGEGEKSVFFQQQALKAKEETAALQRENESLRRMVSELRGELDSHRRGCGLGLGSSLPSSRRSGSRVKRELDLDFGFDSPVKRLRRSSTRAPDYHESLSPSSTSDISTAGILEPMEERASSPEGDLCCGLCSSETSCFCSDVGFKIDHSHKAEPVASPIAKFEMQLDLESSQVALPLRLRKSTGRAPVWAIHSSSNVPAAADPATQFSTKPSLCNGDPSNCPACQDDPFGKAFCNALSESVCSSNPCAGCPSGSCGKDSTSVVTATPLPAPIVEDDDDDDLGLFESLADLPCCGDPSMCGSLSCGPRVKVEDEDILPRSVPSGVKTVETVPCNEAWTALKCHPNIAFADLQMLADVVAKRTHCDGPVAVPSPSSSSLGPPPFGLGDTLASYRTPALVPHESLVCAADAGQRKRLTVERGAVNEALAILDTSFGRGGNSKKA